MKRKLLVTIMLLLLAIICVFTLVFCNENNNSPPMSSPTKLSAPNVTLSGDTAIWNENANADKFEISIDGNLSYVDKSVISKKLTDGQTFKVRAIGDGINYSNSDWSNSVTYIPPVNDETYTVIWKNGDVVLETDIDVVKGLMPTYDGETPTKLSDAQYSYEFSGWSPEIAEVSGDITYIAEFTRTLRKYTVTWKNGDTVLELDEGVEYGTNPSYDGDSPKKEATDQYTYTFKGWTPLVSYVTGDVTYAAEFDKTINSYTVTFYNEDGSNILDRVNVPYGEDATYSKATPVKNATASHSFVFDKWVTAKDGDTEDDLANITSDRAVYASFKSIIKTVKVYIVSSNTEYGAVSVSELNAVPYGSSISVNGNTVTVNGQTITAISNDKTAQYTYSFINWTTELTVDENTIITANFERNTNKYTITWKNGDEVLKVDENVSYGETPVYNGDIPEKPDDTEYVYTFSGWSPAITTVTEDITYQAQFTNAANVHIVKFYDEDGITELGRIVVKHGESAVYPNSNPTKQQTVAEKFVFEKWVTSIEGSEEASLTTITADTVVYAKYTSSPRIYKITLIDGIDGSTIAEAEVEYGTDVPVPTLEPPHDGYRFDGWDSEFGVITSDMRITSKYVKTYEVSFIDYDDTRIYTQIVDVGANVQYPESPTRAGYRFAGWDITQITNIQSDIIVRATYIEQCNITFVDYDGSIIKSEDVDVGSAATAPNNPSRTGYKFVGWDMGFDNITSDTTITALYEILRYTVTFMMPDGTVIQQHKDVKHGFLITAPTIPEYFFDCSDTENKKVLGFTKWDKVIGEVTEDTTISAIYQEKVTEPAVVMESVSFKKGSLSSVELRVYVYGTFNNVYGLNISSTYNRNLIFDNVTVNFTGNESLHTATNHNDMTYTYDYSCVDTKGFNIDTQLAVFTFTFKIDKDIPVGKYEIAITDETYFIGSDLVKISPIIVSGCITVTE